MLYCKWFDSQSIRNLVPFCMCVRVSACACVCVCVCVCVCGCVWAICAWVHVDVHKKCDSSGRQDHLLRQGKVNMES